MLLSLFQHPLLPHHEIFNCHRGCWQPLPTPRVPEGKHQGLATRNQSKGDGVLLGLGGEVRWSPAWSVPPEERRTKAEKEMAEGCQSHDFACTLNPQVSQPSQASIWEPGTGSPPRWHPQGGTGQGPLSGHDKDLSSDRRMTEANPRQVCQLSRKPSLCMRLLGEGLL